MGDSLRSPSTGKERTHVKGQGFGCEVTEESEILGIRIEK